MEKGFFQTKQIQILIALTFLMIVIALGSIASLNFEKTNFLNPNPATITVVGEGEVLAVPDIGQFSFSVRAEGEDAKKAQATSADKINSILDYLKEQEIADKDVKTENYQLNQKWRWEKSICERNEICPPNNRVPDGFEVTQFITVKIRDTKIAAKIIAGVGERNATNISGLNFVIEDDEKITAEARTSAITDAKEKAQILAQQLGVRITRLVAYHEEGDYPVFQKNARAMVMDESVDYAVAELPVGEEGTRVQVNITYEVQ